jgi:hypothetical protein
MIASATANTNVRVFNGDGLKELQTVTIADGRICVSASADTILDGKDGMPLPVGDISRIYQVTAEPKNSFDMRTLHFRCQVADLCPQSYDGEVGSSIRQAASTVDHIMWVLPMAGGEAFVTNQGGITCVPVQGFTNFQAE